MNQTEHDRWGLSGSSLPQTLIKSNGSVALCLSRSVENVL
jgi:hypothetical protein